MSGRKATGEVYTKLVNQGPQAIESSEYITTQMREDGVRRFDPSTSYQGGSQRSGNTHSIYYIEGKHEPKNVILAWLDYNKSKIKGITNRALHYRFLEYGDAFRDASEEIFKERGEWAEMHTSGESSIERGGECPLCGAEYTRQLPDHLPCEESP